MTFPQADFPNANGAPDNTSTALLALKRFVRGTLRQVGMGLVSLMVILNLGTHAPNPSQLPPIEIFATELTPAHPPIHSQDAQLLDLDPTIFAAHAMHHPIEPRIERRIGRGITYHHLTSARLSISTAPQQAIVSVAKAR
jgi:hypothetical protein